jgi:acyl-CoA thioesterase-2
MGLIDDLSQFSTTASGFEIPTLPSPTMGVLGAHLVFQQMLLAEQAAPDRRVLELQTTFLHNGFPGEPAAVKIVTLREGRSFCFLELTIEQRAVLTCRSEILLTVDEADFLRGQARGGERLDLSTWQPSFGMAPVSYFLDPGSDRRHRRFALMSDDAVDPTTTRAILAMAAEPEVHLALFGADAEGGSEVPFDSQASAVLKQNVTLLEPADLAEGVVVHVTADYAGLGRSHGHGEMTDCNGRLLATFSTTGMLRARR